MKIVYVASRFPCLRETFIAREIEQLAEIGHHVVICPLRNSQKADQGLSVEKAIILRQRTVNPVALLIAHLQGLAFFSTRYLACWRDILTSLRAWQRIPHMLYILSIVVRIAYALRSSGVEHVRGHFLNTEAVGTFWLARLLKVPYSITGHVTSIRYDHHLMTTIIRDASFLVSDTQQVYDLLRQLGAEKVELIRNGLDLAEFPPPTTRRAADPPIVLAVGGLVEPKGFDILIEACHLIRQTGRQFVCRIIGDGPERAPLERLCRDLDLGKTVILPGSKPFVQLREEYAQAAIFVMPSKASSKGSDGLPTVLIESFALKIPVVATRHAGIPDLIKNGETGVLVEQGSPADLARGILFLLDNPDLQIRYAEAGRELVEEQFDLQRSAARLSELVRQYGTR